MKDESMHCGGVDKQAFKRTMDQYFKWLSPSLLEKSRPIHQV